MRCYLSNTGHFVSHGDNLPDCSDVSDDEVFGPTPCHVVGVNLNPSVLPIYIATFHWQRAELLECREICPTVYDGLPHWTDGQ